MSDNNYSIQTKENFKRLIELVLLKKLSLLRGTPEFLAKINADAASAAAAAAAIAEAKAKAENQHKFYENLYSEWAKKAIAKTNFKGLIGSFFF